MAELRNQLSHLMSSIAMSLLVFACFAYIQQRESRIDDENHRIQLEKQLSQVGLSLSQSLNLRLSLTQSLAAFVENFPDFSGQQFTQFAEALQKDYTGIRSLQLAPDGVVTYVTNLEENRAAVGHNLHKDPRHSELIKYAIKNDSMIVDGPIPLIQGGHTVIARHPIYIAHKSDQIRRFWGFATVLIELDALLEESGLLRFQKDHDIAITDESGYTYKGESIFGVLKRDNPNTVNTLITMPGTAWKLYASPKAIKQEYSILYSKYFWLVISIISIASGVALYQLLNQPIRIKLEVDRALASLRKKEDELIKSDQRLNMALDTNHEGVWDWDIATNKHYLSPQCGHILGLDVNNNFNMYELWISRIHSQDHDEVKQLYKSVELGKSDEFRHEFRVKHQDGNYRWILVHGKVISRDTNHKPSRAIGTYTDITTKKKYEDDLFMFSRVLDESLNEIYIFDAKTFKFLNVNVGARSNLGYSMHELLDMTPIDIKPDFNAQAFKELTQPLIDRKDSSVTFETRHMRKDGSHYPVEVHLQLLYDDNPVYVAIILDITDRKEVENALRRTQKMEAVGQLTGGIAHDFNNILNIILGNLERLEDKVSGNSDASKNIQSIKKSTLRAADLTHQLLSFSRKEPSRQLAININHNITEMKQLITQSLTPQIAVKFNLDKELWNTKIDPGDFEDALLNLVLNAKDAIPESGIIHIISKNTIIPESNPYNAAEGEYVELIVSDNGTGIDKSEIERIFEPFYSSKDPGKGTGLGLAMVYGFVERSHGCIHVDSQIGTGTSFTILLPMTDAKCQIKTADSSTLSSQFKPGETILIIDDENDLLELAQEFLKGAGYNVFIANNTTKALEIIKLNPGISLVISDIVLPGNMNGYQLAYEIRQIRPFLKILLASGYNDTDMADITGESFEVIEKPYSRNTLVSAANTALNHISH